MKRLISIVLLFSATLILLAHNSVPHNHCEAIVGQIHVEECCSHQQNSLSKHNHGCEDNSGCQLYNLFSRVNIGQKEDSTVDNIGFTLLYIAYNAEALNLNLYDDGSTCNYFPFDEYFQSSTIILYNTLRGPPAC